MAKIISKNLNYLLKPGLLNNVKIDSEILTKLTTITNPNVNGMINFSNDSKLSKNSVMNEISIQDATFEKMKNNFQSLTNIDSIIQECIDINLPSIDLNIFKKIYNKSNKELIENKQIYVKEGEKEEVKNRSSSENKKTTLMQKVGNFLLEFPLIKKISNSLENFLEKYKIPINLLKKGASGAQLGAAAGSFIGLFISPIAAVALALSLGTVGALGGIVIELVRQALTQSQKNI